jgi:protein-disulfide isomerase
VSEENSNLETQSESSQSSNPETQAEISQSPKLENYVEASPEKLKPERIPQDDVITLSRTTLNYVVIAIVFFAVGILVGMIGFGGKSTVDQAAIEVAVSNVLIEAGIMQAPADMAVVVDDDPYLGPEDAPVVIVEFSAYACPYCGRHFEQTFAPLLENYAQYIRYVYRDFPTINPNISVPASLAANCAHEQGKFWEYHNLLFSNQELLGPDYFVQAGEELGLDMVAFNACTQDQSYIQEVNADYSAGIALGISGTPSFYINGKYYSGARPYEYFEGIILRELDEAGIKPN